MGVWAAAPENGNTSAGWMNAYLKADYYIPGVTSPSSNSAEAANRSIGYTHSLYFAVSVFAALTPGDVFPTTTGETVFVSIVRCPSNQSLCVSLVLFLCCVLLLCCVSDVFGGLSDVVLGLVIARRMVFDVRFATVIVSANARTAVDVCAYSCHVWCSIDSTQ